MPRSRDTIPDVMAETGMTDQFKGRAYRCKKCGAVRWTAWANAHRHYPDNCPEADDAD